MQAWYTDLTFLKTGASAAEEAADQATADKIAAHEAAEKHAAKKEIAHTVIRRQ